LILEFSFLSEQLVQFFLERPFLCVGQGIKLPEIMSSFMHFPICATYCTLSQQEDIDLMLSHINSYKRGKLNSRSAYQLFSFIYGDDILPKLNIREIEANDIVLSPKLLKK
jgi:hypothetical protein